MSLRRSYADNTGRRPAPGVRGRLVVVELNQGWLGSKELLRREVGQTPTGNCLWCDDHPDIVDALLPGRRHTAVNLLEQFGKALEFDLCTCATNEDAPSGATGFVDVIDLEGSIVFPHFSDLGSVLRTEDDAMTSDGIVDRNCCWSQIIHIYEATDGLLTEQCKTLVPGEFFEDSPWHEQSVTVSKVVV
jgi:hypothetical protein